MTLLGVKKFLENNTYTNVDEFEYLDCFIDSKLQYIAVLTVLTNNASKLCLSTEKSRRSMFK